MRSILHPYRAEIPVYLGAEGPKNVALAAEIADGWLPMFFSPAMNDFYAAALAEGFGRPGARRSSESFDVVGGPLGIVPDDDVERAADRLRPALALYIGGMGARGVNFHYEVFARMGYEGHARTIQDHYLAGDRKAAIAAVPTALVEDVALIGPWAKIADEVQRWRETVLTTFLASCDLRLLEKVAELVRLSAATSRAGAMVVTEQEAVQVSLLPLVALVLHNGPMSRVVRHSKAWTLILVCWAVAAAVVALRDLMAASVVCLGGVTCFAVAISLAERRWWVASAMAAFGGSLVLGLVTAGNHSQVEHDVVFGVGLAAVAYWAAVSAADRRTRNRRGEPML